MRGVAKTVIPHPGTKIYRMELENFELLRKVHAILPTIVYLHVAPPTSDCAGCKYCW